MIHLICQKLQHIRAISSTRAYFFSFSTLVVEPILKSSNSADPQSFLLSYLVNSCGLSIDSATSACRKLQFETTDQLDSIFNVMKTHGLTQTHINNLISSRPSILLADPNKTLKPNFELLQTLGISGNSLLDIINKDPKILEASNAKTVVEFFRARGFSEKQILTLTMKRPNLYKCNAEKNFQPKFEYLESLGLSGDEIAEMLSSEPYILERSLKNHIKPSVEALRRMVGSDENVLKVIKASYRILEFDEEVLEGNVAILVNNGVPKSNVLKLIMLQPKSLLLRNYQFVEVVEKVKKLGFDPTTKSQLFILAVRSVAAMSKSLWERKWDVYSSFGLSEAEIISAFKLQPMCMITSETKIRNLMDFFLNELKLTPSVISKHPSLLLLSLEKRIIPRCSVLQLLLSKDLITGNVNLVYAIRMTEKAFVRRFVTRYQHIIPEVVMAHQGKIPFQAFPIDLSI